LVATGELNLRHGGADTLEAAPPEVTRDEARELAQRVFGISGSVTPLESERDRNFRVETADGSFVLKVSNPAEDVAAVEMQVKAMLHIARTDPELPIPRLRPTRDGRPFAVLDADERRRLLHMVTFVEGEIVRPADLGAGGLHAFGAAVARVAKALRGFFHPAAARLLLWDVKHAGQLRPLVRHLDDPGRMALVAQALDGFEARALPVLPGLRAQVVHGDLTLTNVLFDAGGSVTGIIDFGDMAHTPLVCDLAVALAAVFRGTPETFDTAEAVLRGYGTVTSLEDGEAAVLADAIVARLVATVVISAWRARRFPENASYIGAFDAATWPVLELFDELGPDEVGRRLRRACTTALAFRAPALPAPSATSTADLADRRRRLLGPALAPLSYDRPIHIVRAEGVWMFDLEGRRYLDAYNNVPVVGHGHPRVAEAVANQTRILNTNSRYLHEAALELAERLTATMPEGLDTCLFVNSGSEANDLAWRLATAATGATGAIVSAQGYYGMTDALTDLSPTEWRQGEEPAHVATVPAPDGFRGAHGREMPGWAARYAASVGEAAGALRDAGYRPAAMFLDSAWTSDGIFTEATDYVPEAMRRVRGAGGLFVADEVQAGFGRFGSHFWGFDLAGVTPDVVTLGKPMGNGYPVGGLVTRAEVAEEFARRRAPVFSTFGGNPVACVAALAVLDVIEEEKLVASAADVGASLRSGLDELARDHSLVGDVRGAGLLVGVDLVHSRETREPAPKAARAVSNGMRERGVLIGTTGRDANVLKIRPPLAFRREHADRLLAILDSVLTEVERAPSR
jgi:4-aminobutyrate aminotransferase-like enzyme/Ser/Thr protein kinase RdoA (MazF antagonist)